MRDENTCWECGKKMREKRVEYSLYGVKIGNFPAKVCETCKEEYFSEEISRRITNAVKKKGLWGLQTTTKIGQAGTTLDIRLPKKIIQFLNLEKGKEVKLYPEGKNKLVISV